MSDDKQKPEDQSADPSRWAADVDSGPESAAEQQAATNAAESDPVSESAGEAGTDPTALADSEEPEPWREHADEAGEAGSEGQPPEAMARSTEDAGPMESPADEADARIDDAHIDAAQTDPDRDVAEPEASAAAEEFPVAAAAVGASAPAKSGRAVAWLSLLLALGAAGGAGYLYYELIYLQPFASKYAPLETVDTIQQVERNVTRNTELEQSLEAEVETLRAELARVESEQSSAATTISSNVQSMVGEVEQKLREQTDALRTTEQQLMTNLNEVANRAPPTRAEWKVAEVEYLLRIANHRVLMEKDADGGLRLLQTADAMLAELDDFGFYQVRAQLAEEILALRRVGEVDSQGMFLRLEAVKRELDGLPLKVPELLRDGPSTTLEEDAGLWARILDQFTPYFAYRSELRTRIEPLLAPDEITYLELNLRLMLEQAQLASLRAQQEIFEQSLDNAADWIKDHLDYEDADVARIVAEIEDLRDSSVLRDLPDISGSLRSLLDTERGT